MKGKDKCKILKEIRQEIAKNNDIEFITSECKHVGDCRGTCPKCEEELAYLERELEKKRALGKKTMVAGIAAASVISIGTMTGCKMYDALNNALAEKFEEITNHSNETSGIAPEEYQIDGDIDYLEPSETDCEGQDCTEEDDGVVEVELDGDVAMDVFE